VQDEVGRTQPLHARRREHAPPAGQVRVRDDGDERYRTVNGALTRTVVRFGFVAAATSTAVT
jgi:hypothetical protein